MTNKSFQQGRKPKNTWLAGKAIGCCGYALKSNTSEQQKAIFAVVNGLKIKAGLW